MWAFGQHTPSARDRTTAMRASKHVEKIRSGPLAHDYGHQKFKNTIFGNVSAILEDFLTELERKNKTQKLHMIFEDMVKLFYFMTFIAKSHILATKGQKSGFFSIFFTCFGHFEGVPD